MAARRCRQPCKSPDSLALAIANKSGPVVRTDKPYMHRLLDIYVNPTQQTCVQFESAELFNAGEVPLLHDRATLKARLSTWAWPM